MHGREIQFRNGVPATAKVAFAKVPCESSKQNNLLPICAVAIRFMTMFRECGPGGGAALFTSTVMTHNPTRSSYEAANAPLLQAAEVEMHVDIDLIERRRTIRPLPCPEAVELNDEASWSTWNELMGQQIERSAAALAKASFLSLFRRKLHAHDTH
jgi:hypothetical protein